jgi:DNA invertase Pin-like site-specific DNA recombinase
MSSTTRAAQYVRMSTEKQDLSVGMQMATNAAYALERGYTLVRTYEDLGISGISIDRREGLKALLADVLAGAADFTVVLVYDVSRLGRFQTPDEAAQYEFICADARVRIEYCAEPFGNDTSAINTLLKGLKRTMAAEYSRELSARIKGVRKRLIEQGFWPNGMPGYGLRREVVTKSGKVLGVLGAGERKFPATHARIIWGPPEEVAVVRRIYRMFTRDKMGLTAFADRLNREGIPAERGRWSFWIVETILINPKYAGRLLSWSVVPRIGAHPVHLPRDQWTYRPAPFPPMISKALYAKAQEERARRRTVPTDEALLDDLRAILARHGRITRRLVRQEARSAISVYLCRFRSMVNAYKLAGYQPSDRVLDAWNRQLGARHYGGQWRPALSDEEMIGPLRALLLREGCITRKLMRADPGVVNPSQYQCRFGNLLTAYQLAGYHPPARQLKLLQRGLPSDHASRQPL